MGSEVTEMIRRALLVALGLLLVLPAAFGIIWLPENASLGLALAGGSLAVFLVGRVLINWIFLKS